MPVTVVSIPSTLSSCGRSILAVVFDRVKPWVPSGGIVLPPNLPVSASISWPTCVNAYAPNPPPPNWRPPFVSLAGMITV